MHSTRFWSPRAAGCRLAFFGLLMVLAWFQSGCAQIGSNATRGRLKVIWDIEFLFLDAKGKKVDGKLKTSLLLSAMETAETPRAVALLRVTLKEASKYKRSRVLADLRRLKKLYRYQGYYRPQVFFSEKTDLTTIAGPNKYRPYSRVKLRIRIIEGPQIKITQIRYKWPKRYKWVTRSADEKKKQKARLLLVGLFGDEPPKNKALSESVANPLLKVGEGFSTPRYKLWKGVLLKRLQDRSYALASIRGQVIINKDAQSAEITFWINHKMKCRFGKVEIKNNVRVSSALVSKLMKFQEGTDYQVQRLIDTQRTLFALGLFRTVSVKPNLDCARARMVRRLGGKLSISQLEGLGSCLKGWTPPADASKPLDIPIAVDIQEDKFNLFKFGFGLVFDGQRQQAAASFNLGFLHLGGGLRTLQIQFNPGYAVLPDILRRFDHGPEITGSITFKQPVFLDRTGEIGIRVLGRRAEEIGDADYSTITPSIWFERPIWGRLTGRIGFNVELAFDVQNPLSLERENYQLFFFEQQLVWDLRDHPLNTTSGVFFSLTMQQAAFGTFQFFKITPEFRFYWTLPLPLKVVLAGRFLYGIMWSQRTGDTGNCQPGQPCIRSLSEVLRQSPLTQRFTSGGANSVRGWTARYLGPLACRIQKQEVREVVTTDTVTPQGQSGSVAGVRVVRQVIQKSESVPEPKDTSANADKKSARERQLFPLMNRGKTCLPAASQAQQARSGDLASRRAGLPLDGRRGPLTPVVQQQALQVVPTGGHHLMEGSIELRIPLSFVLDSLGFVAFFDAGVVQLEPQFEYLAELFPSMSFGFGLRYNTPVGALRFDIAFRIAPDDIRYPLQDHWQVHFSFGEAF